MIILKPIHKSVLIFLSIFLTTPSYIDNHNNTELEIRLQTRRHEKVHCHEEKRHRCFIPTVMFLVHVLYARLGK